jgi:hypothetical protein
MLAGLISLSAVSPRSRPGIVDAMRWTAPVSALKDYIVLERVISANATETPTVRVRARYRKRRTLLIA